MKLTTLVCTAFVWALLLPATGVAFECPKHIKAAEGAINKLTVDMKAMKKTMAKDQMALVHALWDDAKMLLAGAKHNHEKPQGGYDHARSIAKARSALAYAEAADILHWRFMKKK